MIHSSSFGKQGRGGRLSFGGNIGAGKSDHVMYLTEGPGKQILEKAFKRPVRAFFELPYIEEILPAFYTALKNKDENVIYESELKFLKARKRMSNDIEDFVSKGGIAVDDRSLPEDREIFIRALKAQGLFLGTNLLTYLNRYKRTMRTIKPPDLFILLECDDPQILFDRIHNIRKREVESGITLRYLSQLNRFYRCMAQTYPHAILVLNAAEDCPKLRNGRKFENSPYLLFNTDLIVRELRRQNLLRRLYGSTEQ